MVIVERRPRTWPLWLLALPAFVAVWSGWVGMGRLCGFGAVQPLPGIWDSLTLDTSITLPIGMEVYAAYALRVWLSDAVAPAAVAFAKRSTLIALTVGAAGQIVYHLLTAAGVDHAPWPITAMAATIPVAVLGMGATLAHLVQQPHDPHDRHAGTAGNTLPSTHTAVDAPISGVARQPQKPAPRRTTTTRPATNAKARASATGTGTAGDTATQVAALLAADRHLTSAAIADRLGCSERTARRHRTAALKQLEDTEHAEHAKHVDQAAVVVDGATSTAAVAPIRITEPEHTDSEHLDTESEGDAA